MKSKISKAQSQLCLEYMKFLDKKIKEERAKNTVRIVEKVAGDMVLVYNVSK